MWYLFVCTLNVCNSTFSMMDDAEMLALGRKFSQIL